MLKISGCTNNLVISGYSENCTRFGSTYTKFGYGEI